MAALITEGLIYELLNLPSRQAWMDYDAEADVLYISFRKPQQADDSILEDDGNIYHYAGEMKHGPIALIDEHMPVLAIALRDHVYEKMLSQMEQAKSRGGIVIALATDGDDLIATKADHVIYLPEMPYLISPIVSVIPLQLLGYHIAGWRGCDVEQPRNLAKSVTVE